MVREEEGGKDGGREVERYMLQRMVSSKSFVLVSRFEVHLKKKKMMGPCPRLISGGINYSAPSPRPDSGRLN